MPYQFPFVIFSDLPNFCVIISNNPKTTKECLYVPSLVCAGFEVYLVVLLPSTFIYGLLECLYMSVFRQNPVMPPCPSIPLPEEYFSSKQYVQVLKSFWLFHRFLLSYMVYKRFYMGVFKKIPVLPLLLSPPIKSNGSLQ